LNDDEFLNRRDFKSFPFPEKTIAIDQLPEAPTYDVSQEVLRFSFPTVPISLLTLIPFFGSCYTRLQKYPFLQEKSASQPRHAQNCLMNHQKAIGPNSFLHLLYDSTKESDCAIVDVQTEPLSVFWYSTKPSIWVILSCTKGWGKDVCLVPGELNEMHRNALSCI
jgi:hypothetical protein